jgi:hypothetical protein
MKTIMIYLPFYIPLFGLLGYFVRHEKSHARNDLLMRQVCKKLRIEIGDKI